MLDSGIGVVALVAATVSMERVDDWRTVVQVGGQFGGQVLADEVACSVHRGGLGVGEPAVTAAIDVGGVSEEVTGQEQLALDQAQDRGRAALASGEALKAPDLGVNHDLDVLAKGASSLRLLEVGGNPGLVVGGRHGQRIARIGLFGQLQT